MVVNVVLCCQSASAILGRRWTPAAPCPVFATVDPTTAEPPVTSAPPVTMATQAARVSVGFHREDEEEKIELQQEVA